MDDKASRKDLYALYDVYHSYRFYYDYYWEHDKSRGKTRQEVRDKIDYILKNGMETGTALDYLCWYAGLNPQDVENMNGIDVLRAIERENYAD
jgi:hypothetical protein